MREGKGLSRDNIYKITAADVAHALLRAASRLVSTRVDVKGNERRQEWRPGTQCGTKEGVRRVEL